ncbi:MAG: type II toxin-antitoxin system RelE/ParE family toxin [Candidatus Scalindua sp. AMX11]|nr:MAG: type II toxin-antitoxin system RelE/ParE family toxin [Candidatus Scalindua sp.]NOG83992.1 type II toxin-antitoxin system RelE/ParE family toxin [Planctomycetota bacterium]RZV88060.1 MAG: type II toxin-antitoxin system RelE/ParE family toxin [Candidatus Scalindua sp. SCAELEC01]TDE63236.1 MAG: type II toxin-antitoxin system RelE/ParE family toxin [Candidatus Scalindua sp. AMX11]GJQ58359.1 MAG: addiction module killer protein [Candidatus Scalindua sp.]
MKKYDIEEYETSSGKAPFGEWLLSLKDERAQAKIRARIIRASFGNFGDWKDIKGAKGVFEMRENYGPGYRIFYAVVGKKVVLLLAGSTKKDQKKTVAKAKEYLTDYVERTKP